MYDPALDSFGIGAGTHAAAPPATAGTPSVRPPPPVLNIFIFQAAATATATTTLKGRMLEMKAKFDSSFSHFSFKR